MRSPNKSNDAPMTEAEAEKFAREKRMVVYIVYGCAGLFVLGLLIWNIVT